MNETGVKSFSRISPQLLVMTGFNILTL